MKDEELTDREKARLHLRTWTRRALTERVLNSASHDRLAAWAREYDEDRNRDSQAAP